MAKKKEFHEELPTKVCPQCGELSMEDAEVCDSCGYSFVPQEDSESATPEEKQDIDKLFDALEAGEDTVQDPVIEAPSEAVDEAPIDALETDPLLDEGLLEDDIESAFDDDVEELQDEPIGENICPKCGSEVDEEALFCPVCSYQLREGEVSNKALIEGLAEDFTLIEKEKIDFSKAIFGEETIVRKVGDKYEALTYPKEEVTKVIEATDAESDVLKADYILRKKEEVTTKELVEAGAVLKSNPDTLDKYYGNTDIDDIYGAGLTDYASVKGIKDDILDIGLPIDTMQILSGLGAKAQTDLGEILKRYEITDLTPTSAKLIVDSDRTEESMREIVVREKTMQSIVSDYMNRVLNRD